MSEGKKRSLKTVVLIVNKVEASGGSWGIERPGWSAGDMETYNQHWRIIPMMNKQKW